MTSANIITIVRIVLVPFVLVILLAEMQQKELIAFIIFVLAAVTDSLDGYVARKYKEVSDLGKFLDPLADKLLVSAALIALVQMDRVDTWAATLIILREIFISAMRFYFLINDASFSASITAKLKTTFQVIAIAILIIYNKLPYSDYVFLIGTAILYIAVFLTMYSGVEYIIRFSKSTRSKDAL